MSTLGNGVTNETVGSGVVANGEAAGTSVTTVDGATDDDGAAVTSSDLPGPEQAPTISADSAISLHRITCC